MTTPGENAPTLTGRSMVLRHVALVLPLAAVFVAVLMQPRIAQPTAYHSMADQRTLGGIPNALNVLSNVPFAIVGIAGLMAVLRPRGDASPFVDPWERWPWAALFVGVALTALGSSWYHLAPDNARLVWDRLPMSIGFMGLLVALIAERIGVRLARRLFQLLLTLGPATVVWWHYTETLGAGDLRPYILMQFGSLLAVVLLIVLYPSHRTGTMFLVGALVAYAGAKVLEEADQQLLDATGFVSGHTLKHLAAALGVGLLALMPSARSRARSATGRITP
jgi:uncharacterized membrane protein